MSCCQACAAGEVCRHLAQQKEPSACLHSHGKRNASPPCLALPRVHLQEPCMVTGAINTGSVCARGDDVRQQSQAPSGKRGTARTFSISPLKHPLEYTFAHSLSQPFKAPTKSLLETGWLCTRLSEKECTHSLTLSLSLSVSQSVTHSLTHTLTCPS